VVDVIQADIRVIVEVHQTQVKHPSSNVSNGSMEYRIQRCYLTVRIRRNVRLWTLRRFLALHVLGQVFPLERFPRRTEDNGTRCRSPLKLLQHRNSISDDCYLVPSLMTRLRLTLL
jgi:hypothetical protein